MKKLVHHIRSKPDHIKSRYVIVLAIIATAIVVAVWIVVTSSIRQNDDTIDTQSPFAIFKGFVSETFSQVGSQISDNKENLNQAIQQAESVSTSGTMDIVIDSARGTSGTPDSLPVTSGTVPITSATVSQDIKTAL